MNTDAETRRKNLLKIAGAYNKQHELADAIGFTAGYASHLLTGHKSIGEKVARKIEDKLGLAKYSLDIDTDSNGDAQDIVLDGLNTVRVAPDELCLLNLLRDLTSKQRKRLIDAAKEFKSENVENYFELKGRFDNNTHAHA
jgi:transcriptional regulator with XRE-family HTH domain